MTNKVTPVIGLEKMYIAKLKKDGIDGVEYDKPNYFEGIKEISIKPKFNTDEFYAENMLWDSETTLANIDIEVNIADLTNENEAFLLGHKMSEEGGIIKSADDVAPEVALLFKANKSKGGTRYIICYKGSFSPCDEDYKGKEGKANFQSKKLKATFSPLHNNKMYSFKIDGEQGMDDSKFFKEVIIPKIKAESKSLLEGSH